MTFIMVTHDQDEALALSSRIAVFYSGNLEQIGTPHEVYDQPATPFVARFIGNTNLIEATLVDVAGHGLTKVNLPNSLIVSVNSGVTASGASAGSKVLLSVKPQLLTMHAIGENPSKNGGSVDRIKGSVSTRNYLGASTEYVVKSDMGVDFRISSPTSQAGVFNVGDYVSVGIDWNTCTLLKDNVRKED